MATWEQDQNFRRDTIAEIDREYGKTKERERIVALIGAEYTRHDLLATKFAVGEANREMYNNELSAMVALAYLLGILRNEK